MTAAEIAAIGSLGARGGNRITVSLGAMTTASSISSSSSVSSGTGVMAPRNRDSAGRPQSCTKRADPAAFAAPGKSRGDERPPLERLWKRARPSAESPSYILLSFFDGIGSAALICSRLFAKNSTKWQGLAWEIDPDLVAFSSKQFPNMEHRGDIDSDEPSAVVERLRQLDPACKATVIIAAGPPCPDHSRIRSDAPGSQGSEGSKFLRFADFKKLEAAWDYAQPIMIVENVVPENKQDVKLFEQKLSAQAVVCDAADLGVISRPRLWWTRLPWQQLSNCQNAPARLRWGIGGKAGAAQL